MKILIDGHMLGSGEGGNERYISNLAKALNNLAEVELLVTTKQKGMGGISQIICRQSNFARYLWQIPAIFKQSNYDAIITTYFVSPLVANRNVIVVHDLLPYRHPEFFNLRERLQFFFLGWSMKVSMGILVPSQFVKDEIISFYPDLNYKIFITPEASDPAIYPMTTQEKTKLESKYKKNSPAVLIFGSKLQKRPVRPILEGLRFYGKSIKTYLLQRSNNLKIEDYSDMNLIVLDKLSDKQLCEYYNLVDVVIYPTIYEGFGLPVIEAMQARVPIVTTNILPIKEIAKKSAYYIDLGDKNSIKKIFKKIMADEKLKNIKLNYGYNRAKQYSWEKTATKAISALKSLSEK